MNTTLSTPRRHDHPPIAQPHQVRRVGLLDRTAMHLGVALIKWGRRPLVRPSRESAALHIEQQLARVKRERANELAMRLSRPWL